MTTDLASRKANWQSKYQTLRNWTVLAAGLSKVEAQEKENEYAKRGNCDSGDGGNDPDQRKSWSVYRFEY